MQLKEDLRNNEGVRRGQSTDEGARSSLLLMSPIDCSPYTFKKKYNQMYQVLHPEQNRLLSVREYARSQGFRCVELLIIMEKVKRS